MSKFEYSLSRRTFLAGTAAIAGAAAIAGTVTPAFSAPVKSDGKMTVVAGSAPNNCGGRCVLKAYVQNGTVKRFVSDERPDRNLVDGTGDNPQRRACVRCRSKKEYMYQADRLLYPLKQTGERGDLNSFKRISWDQAFKEIAAKSNDIKSRGYSARNFYVHYATGDGAAFPRASGAANQVAAILGGNQTYRSSYSFPCIDHVSWFVFGPNDKGGPAYNRPFMASRQAATKSELIVLWSHNPAETIFGTNTAWYITQARDMGAKLVAVDSHLSKTATLADEFVSPIAGTDCAVMLGMMYHLLKNGKLSDEMKANNYAFIKDHVFGFFDEPAGVGTRAEGVSADEYFCPAGASLSAYIFGDDDFLVKKGLNVATSVYPNNMGYNVNGTKDAPGGIDQLFGKKTIIYGQTPKTPEWAEMISGVPADTIRKLAEEIASKKTTIYIGGGWQRSTEGEQAIWMSLILGMMTGNFGELGRAVGWPVDQWSISGFDSKDFALPNPLLPKINQNNPEGYDIYDVKALTAPKNTVTSTRKSFQICNWLDVFENGGTGKSRWNDGQVKNMPAMKILFNFGGNCLANQNGEVQLAQNVLRDRDNCELIVATDFFMNPSTMFADYVLPAAMPFERVAGTTTWNVGENLLYMAKAVEPLGESLSDFKIGEGIAAALGNKQDYSKGKTEEELVRDAFNNTKSPTLNMTFEQWQKEGIFASNSDKKDEPFKVNFTGYRKDPKANGLLTPSGRFEAYSQAMMEDYEARFNANNDADIKLVAGKDKDGKAIKPVISSKNYNNLDNGRFVYPIPMYIPLVEGRHACDMMDGVKAYPAVTKEGATRHPDLLGTYAKGYKYTLHTYHMMYRSHSMHQNNKMLTAFYKRDNKGEVSSYDTNVFKPLKNGIFNVGFENFLEPVWLNPKDAKELGLKEGDKVKIENSRGAILASVTVTNRTNYGNIMIGQGSWTKFNDDMIDIGGNANSITTSRPSRICQGMTQATDNKVRIVKA